MIIHNQKAHFIILKVLVECVLTSKNYALAIVFFAASCQTQEVTLKYPKAPKTNSTTSYFSETISDPYQVLENESDSIVDIWYQKQNQLANNILDKVSGRKKMLATFLEYDDRVTNVILDNKITSNGNHFYLKRGKNENIASLYFKKNYDSEEVLLYDPKIYNTEVENSVISYFKPSWNGEKVAIAVTNSGKEISDVIILTVSDQSIAPQVIPRARPESFLGISWLPDNSGFTFLQFGNSEAELNLSVLYKLGEPVENVKPIFGTGVQSNITIASTGVYPITKIFNKTDPYVIGYIATVENFWDAYVADMDDFINGTPKWTKFHSKAERLFTDSGRFIGDNYIIKSDRDFDSNALYEIDLKNLAFAKAKLICTPPNNEILQNFVIKKDAIYYTTTNNGVSTKLYKCKNGKSEIIYLPNDAGTIYLLDNPADDSSLYVSLSGWTMNNQRYLYNLKSEEFVLMPLSTRAEYPEFSKIISKEIEYESHDGVLVPLSIIYDKNIVLDKSNPTLFYGYGSYGTSIEPFYSTTFLHWIKEGGILCIPHVRGGGEKGEQWHQDGMMNKKENTWKDLIASAEYMIDKNYTSAEKIAIYSSSAGGIMIGKAVTDRPELFAVAIAEVPIMNPIRSEARKGGGGSNMLEYGSISDSIQTKGLIKMDPYLSLKSDVEYPAFLLTAGENDPRVPKWMPGKFAARAQEYSSSPRPILFRIDSDSGHGTVDEKLKYYQEYVDVFSFAFWQTGHKDFFLKD
ncbi:prolyl oligopeptidase family serine peptidase [Dokdonia genika]|uniref:prolyl oligopeptidase n=1 Tax=Dokdonia genika TaxID=308113 RepID=A0ABV9L7P2_9FLAO